MRGVLIVLVLLVLAASHANAVRSKKFYDILGVPEDADDRVIKRAYKKQALKWHPDRHADKSQSDKKKAEERFKDVAHAYETLSDPQKRQVYDQFGEEGLKQSGPGGAGGHPGGFQFHGDPFEMFNAFFGGGGGGGGGNRQFHFSTGGSGQGFHFQGGGFPGGGFPGGGGFGGGGHQQHGAGGAGLYDDDGNVLNLDQDSFPGTAKDNPWVYLVEFYAPWCGHCQQLAPKWKQVASSLKGVVKVAAVDCEQHKSICSQRGVRGYPTIMALSPFSSTWQEYQGDRSASSISSWATSLIGNAAFTVSRTAELQSLLQQCGGSSTGSGKRSSGRSSASWSVCLLLISEKTSAPALWKALSVAFRGKVAFGFVSSGAHQVLQQLGAVGELGSEKSRVAAVCNGDIRTAEVYKGTLKSEPLQRHINSYASGKKCASQVVLDSSTDLSSLKVAQLKALVQGRGIDCAGCFEKGDYIAAIREWLANQQAASNDNKSEL